MNSLPESIIQELVEQKLSGESYSAIRSKLGDRGLSEDEIHETIRQVDEKVLQAELREKHLGQTRQWYRAGLFLALLGLILTIGANRGVILENLPKWIVYSPFFAGILLMFYGRMSQRKRPELFEKGTSRIRKKRPYK